MRPREGRGRGGERRGREEREGSRGGRGAEEEGGGGRGREGREGKGGEGRGEEAAGMTIVQSEEQKYPLQGNNSDTELNQSDTGTPKPYLHTPTLHIPKHHSNSEPNSCPSTTLTTHTTRTTQVTRHTACPSLPHISSAPFSTARFARSPAPSITEGLLVLVQLVIAEITTSPCVSEYSFPSKENGTLVFWFSGEMWKPLNPTYQGAQNRGDRTSELLCSQLLLQFPQKQVEM